jgi:hypothetical protein
MTDKEIDRIIKANIKMAGFISLVKRMREAQKTAERAHLECIDYSEIIIPTKKAEALEREVDEYLKKME